MIARRHVLFALLTISIFASMGASHRTANFVVHAPTDQIAQRIGQLAEHYRREKAILWLGYEMPAWQRRCPLYVKVSMNGPSGATSFNFGRDQFGRGMILGQRMEINGPLDRLMASVLPHEITHTVFAHRFKCPVPRWADEGGSVLSEDDIERVRHDKMVRDILNQNQQIRLRSLLRLTQYPRQVGHLYAQGYSLANYLVNHRADRRTFLDFVAMGMRNGGSNWDNACWTYFRHRSVEELEKTWLQHLRDTKGQDHILLAKNAHERKNVGGIQPKVRTPGRVVRLTVPPSMAFDQSPTARGQSPDTNVARPRYDSRPNLAPNKPRYLPQYEQPRSNPNWQVSGQNLTPGNSYQPVPVRLGTPQFDRQPEQRYLPNQASPVGFPR